VPDGSEFQTEGAATMERWEAKVMRTRVDVDVVDDDDDDEPTSMPIHPFTDSNVCNNRAIL